MNSSLVLTILGPDRTGLVGAIAETVSDHDGSWQESRMAHLAGQFAGILRVVCPAKNREALERDLKSLEAQGLMVMIAHEGIEKGSAGETYAIEITGLDEPGIVKRISATLASLGANVEELHTSLESAAMAGHLLFCTRGTVSVPDDLDAAKLIESLEAIGAGLTVDVQ